MGYKKNNEVCIHLKLKIRQFMHKMYLPSSVLMTDQPLTNKADCLVGLDLKNKQKKSKLQIFS